MHFTLFRKSDKGLFSFLFLELHCHGTLITSTTRHLSNTKNRQAFIVHHLVAIIIFIALSSEIHPYPKFTTKLGSNPHCLRTKLLLFLLLYVARIFKYCHDHISFKLRIPDHPVSLSTWQPRIYSWFFVMCESIVFFCRQCYLVHTFRNQCPSLWIIYKTL